MVSACLNGQTGPHRDYPGFGGQGSALAGYNFLTGWPDREPVGPHGTITDSLAPRFVATALAAGLLYRRRTGRGVHLDVSQVEAAIYSLSPWLLEYQATASRAGARREHAATARSVPRRARVRRRGGRRRSRRRPVGRGRGVDRRRARAADGDHRRRPGGVRGRRGPGSRSPRRCRPRASRRCRSQDFGDVHADPQVAHREHFVAADPPVPRRRPLRAQRLPALRRAERLRPRRARRSARTRTGCSTSCSASTADEQRHARGRRRLRLSEHAPDAIFTIRAYPRARAR